MLPLSRIKRRQGTTSDSCKTMKKRIIKAAASLTLAMLLILASTVPVAAAKPDKPEGIKACIVYNSENDRTVYDSWANVKVAPGPTAKLMTAILAVELLSSRLDDTVLVSAAMVSNVTGNTIGLKMGEHVKLRDMLYAMILTGANDAAQVLAITAAGSFDRFLSKMNARAKELGADSTKYETLTGLDLGEAKTTVTDTLKIAMHAYSLPDLAEIFECSSYTMAATDRADARTFTSRNQFVTPGESNYYDGACGMSFGSTTPSGHCMVVMARRAAVSYVCVILGGESASAVYRAGKTLLNYAFAEYTYKTILSPLNVIGELAVKNAQTAQVTVSSKEAVSVYAHVDEEVSSRVTIELHLTEEELYAPLEKGTAVGYADVYFDGAWLKQVELVTAFSVDQSEWLYFWYTVEEALTTDAVWVVVGFGAFAVAVFWLMHRLYRRRHSIQDDADLD